MVASRKAKPTVRPRKRRAAPAPRTAAIAGLKQQLAEARAQQAATAEILKVIARSPADVRPVLDAIGRLAERLCKADVSVVSRFDGERLQLAALHGVAKRGMERVRRVFPMATDAETVSARAFRGGRVVHVFDVLADRRYGAKGTARAGGWRGALGVPMLREGKVIGVIFVARSVPGPFSEAQIGLLSTFADQAVIAIENVRLFGETREALERQTATAEILKVIASSPSDVRPVFDAIVKSAARLFGRRGMLRLAEDGGLRRRALSDPGSAQFQSVEVMAIDRDNLAGRVFLAGKPMQVVDTLAPDAPPFAQKHARSWNFRSNAAAPLMRDGKAIGVISVNAPEPGALSDKQMELLATFADQAVIAIENVRLFRELEEKNRVLTAALGQQTATAEILRVISTALTDPQPVFDTIVRSALRLLGCYSATMTLLRGGELRLAAYAATSAAGDESIKRLFPVALGELPPAAASVQARCTQAVEDIESADVPASMRAAVRARGWRAAMFVPMLRGEEVLGLIGVTRRVPGPFAADEKALMETFAAQAVIALENVRLFNETREALQRQTATSEILSVISRSQTDVQPVFDTIAKNALRLCDGMFSAVSRFDGTTLHLAAFHNEVLENPEEIHKAWPMTLESPTLSARALRERAVAQIRDVEAEAHYGLAKIARSMKYRSALSVPMLRDGVPVGGITITRAQPGEFPAEQIALLKTFADQAVIAIENVRLFNETREALERQTATAEILKVIASSPSDVEPVFEAIVRNFVGLSGGLFGAVFRFDGRLVHFASAHGFTAEQTMAIRAKYPVAPDDPSVVSSRAILTKAPVVIEDIATDRSYDMEHAYVAGWRRIISVPMLREGVPLGAIVSAWTEPGPVPQSLQDLLKTFADQAVIAIENVRLFNETREALERQTATAAVLQVISNSMSDAAPVFASILESCERLIADAAGSAINLIGDDGLVHAGYFRLSPVGRAAFSTPAEADEAEQRMRTRRPQPLAGSTTEMAIQAGRALNYADVLHGADVPDNLRGAARTIFGGKQSYAAAVVPLLKDGRGLGAITVARLRMGEFSEKELSLLRTFADQAVVAIENARLFNETKESLERQTATAEILKVIASSPSDVQPVFDAIVRAAVKLCDGRLSTVLRCDGKVIDLAAHCNLGTDGVEDYGRVYPRPVSRETVAGCAILDRSVLNVADSQDDPAVPPQSRAMAVAAGFRSVLAVPMLREGEPIGVLNVARPFAGPFSDAHVELLKTFADQAVIAIENVRLLKELQSRTEALTKSVRQLTALGEVGQAISSTLELETVLQTIVQRAVQLTGLEGGSIYEYDESREEFRLQASDNQDPELLEAIRRTPIRKGDGTVGGTAVTFEATQVPDILDAGYRSSRKELLIRAGYRAILTVPLLREDRVFGALSVTRKTPGAFPPEVVELLKTFATQSAMAIQNARLFREIAEKGRQLEEASRHKSNFLASMSHELRTPLNAILGFNEMILGDVYGEVPVDMQPPLAQMQASGKHLLRLINNVLDLAKIEAGRMELALSDYSVHDTVASVHSTLRGIAADKGLEFLASVPDDVPLAHGDGGRMAQCLMNLAGNSLKFTKAGKVEISVEEKDGLLTYRVADTGVGIPPDKIASLFTEFKQTDATIASEYGGTGLGLSISKKFVEMHGGRIWVESELGKGSEFIIEVPLRVAT